MVLETSVVSTPKACSSSVLCILGNDAVAVFSASELHAGSLSCSSCIALQYLFLSAAVPLSASTSQLEPPLGIYPGQPCEKAYGVE